MHQAPRSKQETAHQVAAMLLVFVNPQLGNQFIPSFIEFDSLIEDSLMLDVVIRCLASGIDLRGASWVRRCHCARTSVRGN